MLITKGKQRKNKFESRSNRSIRSGLSQKSTRSGLSRKSTLSRGSSVSIGRKAIKNKEFEEIKKLNAENQFILKNISKFKEARLPAYIRSLSRSVNV